MMNEDDRQGRWTRTMYKDDRQGWWTRTMYEGDRQERWTMGGNSVVSATKYDLFVGTKPEVHKTYPYLLKTKPPKKRILHGPCNSSSGLEPTARAQ